MKDYDSYKQLYRLCKKRNEDGNCKMLIARRAVARGKLEKCNGRSCPVWKKQRKRIRKEVKGK